METHQETEVVTYATPYRIPDAVLREYLVTEDGAKYTSVSSAVGAHILHERKRAGEAVVVLSGVDRGQQHFRMVIMRTRTVVEYKQIALVKKMHG